jgi:hypothetical protein
MPSSVSAHTHINVSMLNTSQDDGEGIETRLSQDVKKQRKINLHA